jgi:hypothetical protein
MIALNEAANYPEKSIALQNHIEVQNSGLP